MELFVNFSEIMHFFKKTWLRFALVVGVFGVVFGLLPLKLVHPTYSGKTTFTVTCGVPNGADSDYHLQYTNILYSRVQSAVALAYGNDLVEKTAQQTGVPKTEISKITAEQKNSSPVVELTVQTTNAAKAAVLSDTAAQILTDQLMADFPNPTLVARITDKAVPLKAQSMKSTMVKTGFLGLILGFILYVCYGLIVVLTDKTIRNSRFVEESLKTPLLAEIPDEGSRACEDSFRKLRASALHQAQHSTTYLIADVDEQNGGDSVAVGFASSLAQTGKKTLLIDTDLRNGKIAKRLNAAPEKTMEDALAGSCSAREAAMPVGSRTNLYFLSGGSAGDRNPADIFAGEAFAGMLQELSKEFDYIVLCAPSESKYPDAENLASLSGAVVLSARYGSTRYLDFGESLRRLSSAGGNVIGFVTTGV